MKHFNELTPGEAERLALLLEEMGEAQQIIGKVLRHGYECYSPDDPARTTNRRLLEKELGDVLAAFDLIVTAQDIEASRVEAHRAQKHLKVRQYLHHQRKPK